MNTRSIEIFETQDLAQARAELCAGVSAADDQHSGFGHDRCRRLSGGREGGELHHQRGVAPHEVGLHVLRGADDVDAVEALQQLFPQDPQLHLGEPVAHAAVDPEPERHVVAGVRPIDLEGVRRMYASFPFELEGVQGSEAAWGRMEEVIRSEGEGGRVKGNWPVSIVMATRR